MTEQKRTIDIVLDKSLSKLDNLTLYEVIDVNCLRELIKYDGLENEFNPSKYNHSITSKLYNDVIQQLTAYRKLYDKKSNAYRVTYYKTSKHKYGRVYPKKSLGLTAFRTKVRNTLLQNNYIDLDMENAQPYILYNICITNDIECPNLTFYINNRENILNEIMEKYNVDRKNAKNLIISIGYLGSFNSWKNKLELEDETPIKFITDYALELKNIAEIIKNKNNDLYTTARRQKQNKKNDTNYLGSFFALYLQEYETRIMECVIDWLICNTEVMSMKINKNTKINVGIYEYDGVKLWKENVNKYGLEKLITDIQDVVYKKLGFKVFFKDKPIENYYEIKYTPYLMENKNNNIDDDDDNIENGIRNELEGAEKVYKLYPHWVCCQGILYVFDDNTGLWVNSPDVYNSIIMRYRNDLRLIQRDRSGQIFLSNISYGTEVSKMKNIATLIRSLCINNEWLKQKECSSLGCLLFNNGYIDMRDGFQFYDKDEDGFNPDIVFMNKINRDFEPMDEEQIEYMESIKKRLFTNSLGEKVGDYYILNIARALMGDMMKRVLFGLGTTDCGKSILTKAIEYSLGEYVGSFNAENLLYRKSSNDEAQLMRWAMLLRFKRIIISNEMKSTSILNGNMLKKVSSGGDSLTGRLHGGNETNFTPHFLVMCLANDLPPISPYDKAVDNRVRVISYKKQFVDEIEDKENELLKDYNLENEIKTQEFQSAFLMMLIKSYVNYKEKGEPEEPEEVINAKKDWIDDSGNVIDKFNETFEITDKEEDFLESKIIQEWLKEEKLGITAKKMGMEIATYVKKMGMENVKTSTKRVAGRPVRGWIGIKEPVFSES